MRTRVALLALLVASPAFAQSLPGGGGSGSSNLTGGSTPVSGGNCTTVGNFLKVGASNVLDCAGSSASIAFPQAATGTINSGGIPYFSNTTTMTSSAALAANALVVGGGAGVAPSTVTTNSTVLTALGSAPAGSGVVVLATSPTLVTPNIGAASATSINKLAITAPATAATFAFGADNQTYTFAATGGTVLTSTGSLVSGNCLKSNASGQIIDAGAACGGGGGTPAGSSGQHQYNNGGSFGASNLWEGTNLLRQANTTTAQSFNVFNTTDSNTSPTNYEVGVFDWSTSANVLTIGTKKGGTGTTRNVQIVVGGSTTLDYGVSQAGSWTFNGGVYIDQYGAINAYNNGGIYYRNTSGGAPLLAMAVSQTNLTPSFTTINTGYFGWGASSTLNGDIDTVFKRVAGGIVQVSQYSSGVTGYGVLVTKPTVVGSLPSAATAGAGARAFVTDASACATLGNTVAGGGSTACPVYSDGTNWKIGG